MEQTIIHQTSRLMKKILILTVALLGMNAAQAQQSSGDWFEGLSRKIGFSRMIPPHGLEITYDKRCTSSSLHR